MKPDVLPQKLERVLGTSEFGPSRSLKSSFVLFEGRDDENTKIHLKKKCCYFEYSCKVMKKRRDLNSCDTQK